MIAPRKPRLRRIVAATLLVSGLGIGAGTRADDTPSRFVGTPATAQPAGTPAAPVGVPNNPDSGAGSAVRRSTASVVTPALRPDRPYWLELSAGQREALAPLTSDWERLDGQTKKKWVEIANRYPRMQPEEKTRTLERMREWALLTPDQRRVARDSFARIHAMPPEQRADLLRKYRELPPEKKEALANQAQAGKGLIVPKPTTLPSAASATRRAQIREGAKVRNPALAAAKSDSPITRPAVPPTKPASLPAAIPASAPEMPAGPAPTIPTAPIGSPPAMPAAGAPAVKPAS